MRIVNHWPTEEQERLNHLIGLYKLILAGNSEVLKVQRLRFNEYIVSINTKTNPAYYENGEIISYTTNFYLRPQQGAEP